VSDFGTALLVVGSEPLLVDRAVDERVQAARSARPDAEVIDLGPAAVAEGRFAEAVGGSLFAAASIVVVRDLSAVPAEQAEAIVAAAAHPDDNLCLTLTHPGGVKGKAVLDQLARAKVARVAIEAVKAWDLPAFVVAEARRRKITIDAPTATALVDAVGQDLYALSAAVAQLASDWPGERLGIDLVNRYFAGRAEVSGFAIADAVMAGREQAALGLLRWALATGTSPVYVTSALAGALRSLGKYLDLAPRRLGAPDLARAAGVPPWKLKDLAVQARSWTPAGVARGISAVALADAQVKGAATDADYALERLVLALHAARLSYT